MDDDTAVGAGAEKQDEAVRGADDDEGVEGVADVPVAAAVVQARAA